MNDERPSGGQSTAGADTAAGTARTTRSGASWVARTIRDFVHAGNGGPTGFAALIKLYALHSAGDALLAVGLAGTLFFQVPTGQARGRVALYLFVTMAPFAVIAPVIGPVLDRFQHGRRIALAVTLFGRAGLALVLAGALAHYDPLALYPAAFAVLVLSRAWGVSKSAVVPRVLPEGFTLVQANARLQLAAVSVATLAGGVAVGLSKLVGPAWLLRVTCVVYGVAAVAALRLPPHVDAAERGPQMAWRLTPATRPPHTVISLRRSAASLRGLSGFLVLFVAFLVRTHPVHPVRGTVAIGLLAVAAAVGSLSGTALGARFGRAAPDGIVLIVLAATTLACGLTARWFTLVTVLGIALLASVAQTLSKLSLDAVIQRDVDDEVRASTFAWSETLLQLAWVAGGLLGTVLPISGTWGLAVAAGLLAVALVAALRDRHRARRRERRPGVEPPGTQSVPFGREPAPPRR